MIGLGVAPSLLSAPAEARSRLSLRSGVQSGDVTATTGVLQGDWLIREVRRSRAT